MRKFFILSLLIFIGSAGFAQNSNTLFATYALSNPEPVYKRGMVGGAGYKPVASNSFGLRYLLKSSKIITLETGIEYATYHFKLDYVDNPGVVIPDDQKTAKLISIPVYAHLTLLKYLFVNGGLLIDTEIDKKANDIDKQSGIGFGLGAGVKFRLKILPFLSIRSWKDMLLLALVIQDREADKVC